MKILSRSSERQEVSKSEYGSWYMIKYINPQGKVTWTGCTNTLHEAEYCVSRRRKALAKRALKPKRKPDIIVTCLEDQVKIFTNQRYGKRTIQVYVTKRIGRSKYSGEWVYKLMNDVYYGKVVYFTKQGFKQWTSQDMSKEKCEELRDKRIKQLRQRYENTTKSR